MNEDDLKDTLYQVHFRIRLGVRYHQRRVRFYEYLETWIKGFSVLSGTFAIGSLWHDDIVLAGWVTGFITVLTTLSMVFGFSAKARTHSDLVRRFLEAEGVVVGEPEPSEKWLREVEAKIRTLESSEPPPLGALVVICQNELARADAQEKYVVKIPFFQRLFADFFDFEAPRPQTN